uniref:HK1a2 n=1 Tax=Arundo donax TaxID=35708 RepID=A0A0A9E0J9_ARUDO
MMSSIEQRLKLESWSWKQCLLTCVLSWMMLFPCFLQSLGRKASSLQYLYVMMFQKLLLETLGGFGRY